MGAATADDPSGERVTPESVEVQENIVLSPAQSASTLNVACQSVTGSVRREQGQVVYPGEGTPESPFIVDWEPEDPENPYNWSKKKKWPLTYLVSRGYVWH